eukprot:7111586-Prymnesium_polylepis.1
MDFAFSSSVSSLSCFDRQSGSAHGAGAGNSTAIVHAGSPAGPDFSQLSSACKQRSPMSAPR